MFIGDGELRQELETKLADRGRFLGFVSSSDKAHLINAATLVVGAPDKKEHFGIIYIEALARGTVPVAYSGGGVPSIITSDVGLLTERTPEALGQAVRWLLLEDQKRVTMAAAGRQRAESNYHYATLVKQLTDWLASFPIDS